MSTRSSVCNTRRRRRTTGADGPHSSTTTSWWNSGPTSVSHPTVRRTGSRLAIAPRRQWSCEAARPAIIFRSRGETGTPGRAIQEVALSRGRRSIDRRPGRRRPVMQGRRVPFHPSTARVTVAMDHTAHTGTFLHTILGLRQPLPIPRRSPRSKGI